MRHAGTSNGSTFDLGRTCRAEPRGAAQGAEAQPAVTRVHGIATGIAACWRPPHDDDQVTVRVSFTRDGAVIGEPRIVFVQSSRGRADDAALAHSMADGDTRLHAFAFLRSAWLGDRGAGSGHSVHRSQPGDHRRSADDADLSPSIDGVPRRLLARNAICTNPFTGFSCLGGMLSGWRRATWGQVESQCLGA